MPSALTVEELGAVEKTDDRFGRVRERVPEHDVSPRYFGDPQAVGKNVPEMFDLSRPDDALL